MPCERNRCASDAHSCVGCASKPDYNKLHVNAPLVSMLVAFFSYLHSAELPVVTSSDSRFARPHITTLPQTIGIKVRASKTDPFRCGCAIHLAPSGHPMHYPVQALYNYHHISYNKINNQLLCMVYAYAALNTGC